VVGARSDVLVTAKFEPMVGPCVPAGAGHLGSGASTFRVPWSGRAHGYPAGSAGRGCQDPHP
jgi:hypothetical protein